MVGLKGALESVRGDDSLLDQSARVVGEDIDPVVSGQQFSSQSVHLVKVIEIREKRGAVYNARDRSGAFRVSTYHSEVGTAGGKACRGGCTEPRTRPGNNDRFTTEIECRYIIGSHGLFVAASRVSALATSRKQH